MTALPNPGPLRAASIVALALCLQACTKKPADVPKPAEPVLFKASTPLPVSFSLMKAEGQTGRATAVGTGYRPSFRFAFGNAEATCGLQLPPNAPPIEPGQSATVSMVCDTDVRVRPGETGFTVLEGGRQVGQGQVQLK